MRVAKITSAMLAGTLLISGCSTTAWNQKLDSKEETNSQASKEVLIQKNKKEVWTNFAQ